VAEDLRAITVWYKPSRPDLNLGTAIILDDTLSAGFEVLGGASTRFDCEILSTKYHTTDARSCCRAQIFSQRGTTDIRTADMLARFYRCIEGRDWEGVGECLAPGFDARLPTDVFGSNALCDKTAYLKNLEQWAEQFPFTTWMDVTQAFVATTRALIEFRIWSDNKVIGAGLSQYRVEIIDDIPQISSIYAHSLTLSGGGVYEDGTVDWSGVVTPNNGLGVI